MFALVTGATGFLGRQLVGRLRASGHRVRALIHWRQKAVLLDGSGAEVMLADVARPESLAPAMAGVDVVFHAAALVTNWARWKKFENTTVRGTEHVLQAALAAGVQRFVHISTIRVYDDRYCRRHRVVTEDAPRGKWGFRHFGSYARSKVLAEDAVWRYAARLPVSVIRPAWIYGPGDEIILPQLVRFLSSPGACWPSRTDPCADPIYVTDVADCAIAAALHPKAVGQAYNAAPQQWIGLREFLGALSRRSGSRCRGVRCPTPWRRWPAHLSEWFARVTWRRTAPALNRAGLAILTEDVRHDPSKAQRELDWHSQVSLADGVHATAAWLREREPGGPWSEAGSLGKSRIP